MTFFLVCAAAVCLLSTVVHVQRRARQWKHVRIEHAVETPYSWTTLAVVAAIPLVQYLRFSWRLSWPLVVITPLAAVGLVHVFRDLVSEFKPQWPWKNHARATSYILMLCLALVIAWLLWVYVVTRSRHHHPLLGQAQQRHQRIEHVRDAFKVTLASMSESLTKFEPPVQKDYASFLQIKDVARDLAELAEDLLAQYEMLVAYRSEFVFLAGGAPNLFRGAADVWRQYGAEERKDGFEEIAQRYEEVAALYDAYGDLLDAEEDDLLSLQELHEIMRFINHAHLLLVRLAENTPPSSAAEMIDRRNQLEAQIRFFIARFDQLRSEIKNLTQEVRRRARVDQSVAAPRTARSNRLTSRHVPSRPVRLATCRAEVARVIPERIASHDRPSDSTGRERA